MSNGKISGIIDLNYSSIAVSDIERTIKFLQDLKKKILASKPAKYGSDEWWEKSDAKAMEEYKKGNYLSFKNVDDAIKYLDS